MTRFVPAVAALVVLLFGGVTTAQAADTVTSVATALQKSPVYVAANIPGTSSDTASSLQQQLKDGDNVVIVILPASALDQTEGGIQAFARQLDAATGHKRIIGMAAGSQFAGYSSLLPGGVAADLMQRATSVSEGAPETLQTFVRNVHDWQRANPTAPASKPQAKKQDSGPSLIPVVIAVIAAALAVLLVAIRVITGGTSTTEDRVKFSASPDLVRDKLRHIQDLRSQVNDPALKSAIVDLCRHCEMYFRRNRGQTNFDRDASTFEQHLDSIVQVLEQYIAIQDNMLYYDRADARLHEGYTAVRDFADSVLETIRHGNAIGLLDFEVNTKILSAQRRRYL